MTTFSRRITIATRKSTLALWQANFVRNKLMSLYPDLEIDIKASHTLGDTIQSISLSKIGGKGLFVKELQELLLRNEADIAVHSMKDVPSGNTEGLCIPTILAREDPRDALCVNSEFLLQYPQFAQSPSTWSQIPPNPRVGTSSLRRQAQLLLLHSGLKMCELRGNVDTRLKKLDIQEFDAIVLAVAGLKRLGFLNRIQRIFSTQEVVPAVGQGALGIECRKNDTELHTLLAPLHHRPTGFCVMAERAMNDTLGGSCQLPVAGLGEINAGKLHLRGMVATPDGRKCLRAETKGSVRSENDAQTLGIQLAQTLIQLGANEIIVQCKLV